jgi:hypothetical protein
VGVAPYSLLGGGQCDSRAGGAAPSLPGGGGGLRLRLACGVAGGDALGAWALRRAAGPGGGVSLTRARGGVSLTRDGVCR